MLVMAVMKHGPAARRKFHNAIRLARAHTPDHLPAGYLLTDPIRTPDPLHLAARLPADMGIILRHFGLEPQIALARPLAAMCRERGLAFLIAADPGLAIAAGADGVHWPARLAGVAARRSSAFAINTMSAHTPSEARRAQALAMDGVIYSTIFSSGSPTASLPIGLMRFAAIARSLPCPVYALGGIDGSNVERTAQFGGFASVSGLKDVFD